MVSSEKKRVSGPALQNVHLVIGLDAADMFWVGLCRFVEGDRQENVVSGDRFGVIPGHNSNQWWLSWVTISELDPAAFDGIDGVGRLTVDQNLAELVECVLGICRQYLAILAKRGLRFFYLSMTCLWRLRYTAARKGFVSHY